MPSGQKERLKLYKSIIPSYRRLTEKTKDLLSNIIDRENIECSFPISARTKDYYSFWEKVDRKGYENPLADMTDITGLRIVLHSEANIGFVKEIIRERFKVDQNRSIDKKEQLGKYRFGYSGVNYVVSLPEDHPLTKAHAEFEGKFFEIQILTLCQLVWSEMQRKIEYKTEDLVSYTISRRLAMLCALFELADVEFQYLLEKGVEELLPLQVTLKSLRIYVAKSGRVKKVFSEALRNGYVDRALPEEDLPFLEELHEACQSAKLRTVLDVDSLVSNEDLTKHLFASIKKRSINIRSGPTLMILMLLYHSDRNFDRHFLLGKDWSKDSIEFIIDRD